MPSTLLSTSTALHQSLFLLVRRPPRSPQNPPNPNQNHPSSRSLHPGKLNPNQSIHPYLLRAPQKLEGKASKLVLSVLITRRRVRSRLNPIRPRHHSLGRGRRQSRRNG